MDLDIKIQIFRDNQECRLKYFMMENRTLVIKDLEEGVEYWLLMKVNDQSEQVYIVNRKTERIIIVNQEHQMYIDYY